MDSAEELAKLNQKVTQTQLAHQQALQLSHYKGTFLARTSHELRSPLSSLMGLQQLILADLCETPEEEREFVEQAHVAAKRLLGLLDRLVDVSKLEHGATQISVYPIALQQLLADAQGLVQLQAANKGYGLDIAPVEPDLLIEGDPKRLVQTLVSLMDTAIDTILGGTLELTHERQANQVRLLLTIHASETIWSMEQIQTPPTADIEAQDVLEPNLEQNNSPDMSPSLTWMLAEAMLKQMGGQLKLLSTPAAGDELTKVEIILREGQLLDLEAD